MINQYASLITVQTEQWQKFNEFRNVLTNKDVNMHTRRKLLESCVRSRLRYGTQAWYTNEQQLKKLEVYWFQCMRNTVKGGWKRKHVPIGIETDNVEADYSFVYSNEQIRTIIGAQDVTSHINAHYLKYIAHVCRDENNAITKKMMFARATRDYYRDQWIEISKLLVGIDQAKRTTQSRTEFAELVRHRISMSP